MGYYLFKTDGNISEYSDILISKYMDSLHIHSRECVCVGA